MNASLVESAESIIYPSSDNKPVAETFIHFYAIITTLEVLKQYLEGQQATLLANQFLYYSQGYPKMRVAPDVMVIYDVAPGGRDNYKIWEEGQAPSVVFEMTSASTQEQDKVTKKSLYEQMGVKEYWLFDPKGEWVTGQLQGYRLAPVTVEGEETELYVPITDGRSEPLKLRVQVEGQVLGFYREDTGEKLLLPTELAEELRRTAISLEQERSRADQASQRAERLAERLRQMGEDPEKYL
jgi:Uma2 family endonuclease